MANFIASGISDLNIKPNISDHGVVSMNTKGNVNFRFRGAKVIIISDQGHHIGHYASQRGVIEAPNGAQVLPYFWRDHDCWVVMVEQFRIAVRAKTTECPGGEVDLADVQAVMAKELKEEAKISVDPSRIKVVFSELIQPSTMSSWAYGGIVELDQAEVQDQAVGGEWHFGEYTAVTSKSLVDMLKLRDSGKHNLDLWGSRLLDEVAKEVGLLKKCY